MTALDSAAISPKLSSLRTLTLGLRLALRDLRGGIRAFTVLLLALALGVGAITAIGALKDAIETSLDSQGQQLLGGDVAISRMHQQATAEERQALSARGPMSETAALRAMVRPANPQADDLPIMVELMAADGTYPLVGSVVLDPAQGLTAAFAKGPDGRYGVAVEPILLERLRLKVGDDLVVGSGHFAIRAAITTVPDRVATPSTFGPRVLVSLEGLGATALIQPGSLIRWTYRLLLDDAARTPDALDQLPRTIADVLPQSGFQFSDRRDPAPGLRRSIERLGQFLTLVGLTALIVGGIGVANAVAHLIDRKRGTIATFRSLGAGAGLVRTVLLYEVLVMALLGILAGLVIGSLVPLLVIALIGDALPITLSASISFGTLATAAAFGLAVTLLFALWPLGQAEEVTATELFRETGGGAVRLPRWPYLLATAEAGLAVTALALIVARQPKVTLSVLGGVGLLLAFFLGLGVLIGVIARRVPRPSSPTLSVIRSSLGAPQSLTTAVTLSLGLGLSILIAVALVDRSLVGELATGIPAKAPGAFVLDLGKAEAVNFAKAVNSVDPTVEISSAPMLRGRLVTLKGVPVEEIKAGEGADWVLRGDRGLTFSEDVPKDSKVVQGAWWPKDYAGEPQVSFDEELAKELHLTVGDTLTVNVLGRNLTAKISNLRTVEWRRFGINFVMIFSPNALKAAPYNILSTLFWPKPPAIATEAAVARAIGKAYPAATIIRVRDAIDAVSAIVAKVMTAIRVASSVTLAAGAIVLGGALATAGRRRIYTAVVMKAIGATRGRILLCHLVEYLILWLVTVFAATLLGATAAWLIATYLMEVPFRFDFGAVAIAGLAALALMLVFGLIGTARALAARPVAFLRSE